MHVYTDNAVEYSLFFPFFVMRMELFIKCIVHTYPNSMVMLIERYSSSYILIDLLLTKVTNYEDKIKLRTLRDRMESITYYYYYFCCCCYFY